MYVSVCVYKIPTTKKLEGWIPKCFFRKMGVRMILFPHSNLFSNLHVLLMSSLKRLGAEIWHHIGEKEQVHISNNVAGGWEREWGLGTCQGPSSSALIGATPPAPQPRLCSVCAEGEKALY
jgi:hypothetical protein